MIRTQRKTTELDSILHINCFISTFCHYFGPKTQNNNRPIISTTSLSLDWTFSLLVTQSQTINVLIKKNKASMWYFHLNVKGMHGVKCCVYSSALSSAATCPKRTLCCYSGWISNILAPIVHHLHILEIMFSQCYACISAT